MNDGIVTTIKRKHVSTTILSYSFSLNPSQAFMLSTNNTANHFNKEEFIKRVVIQTAN